MRRYEMVWDPLYPLVHPLTGVIPLMVPDTLSEVVSDGSVEVGTFSALKCCRHSNQTITLYPLLDPLEGLDQDGDIWDVV